MNTELAVLIPAYYEEPRIRSVLEVVCNYQREPRVVVIDDGSPDGTAEACRDYPVEVVSLERNMGKGAALQAGIKHTGKADFWLFLDADLINFRENHMEQLLQPLRNGEAEMTVGVFKGGRTITDMAQRYFGILNGQRGLSGEFVSNLPDLRWCRFGVEIFLSKYAAYQGIPVSYPHLKEITHYTKESKFGFSRGFPYRLQMFKECLYSLSNWKKYV